jgi:hypothetical protein
MARTKKSLPAAKTTAKPTAKKPAKEAVQKGLPAKHAGGRPTDYKQEYNEQVFKLCLLGAMDKDIADFFDVSEKTINLWKKRYPEFFQSIKRGKMQADANVAASLYKCAIGFVKEDCEEVFQHKGEIVRANVKKYFPPNVTAQIFVLKNRQPKLWRDKQTQVLENPDGSALFQGFQFLPFTKIADGDEG